MSRTVPLSRRLSSAAGCAAVLALAACTPSGGAGPERVTVTVVAEDTWKPSSELKADLERQLNVRLVVRHAGGDAAELADRLSAPGGRTLGDVVMGVDASTAPRVLDLLRPYTSPEANTGQQRFTIDQQQRLSAVDLAAVCVLADEKWFDDQDKDPPERLADLTEPGNAGLLAVPDPGRSPQGLTFLRATVAKLGDGWRDYWSALAANGLRVVPDASKAYREQFTGASADGTRPLVVTAALAGAAKRAESGAASAVDGTCSQRTRYAGVLADTPRRTKAERVIDFLLSQQFQSALAEDFATYPTRENVALPDGWDDIAPQPSELDSLPADVTSMDTAELLSGWRQVTRRG